MRDSGECVSESWLPTGCIKVVDDRNDYHHCYDDYYISVCVGAFENSHSSLPFWSARYDAPLFFSRAGRILMIVLSEAVRIKSLGRRPLCFGAYGVQRFTDACGVQ
jgi:hypothetical protein